MFYLITWSIFMYLYIFALDNLFEKDSIYKLQLLMSMYAFNSLATGPVKTSPILGGGGGLVALVFCFSALARGKP